MVAEKRDWAKLVKANPENLVMAPEKFIPAIKEWNDKRKVLNKLANEAAHHELETRMVLENTVLEVRKYLAENGYPNIWLADVGFEASALDDGAFVLTIGQFNNQRQRNG